MTMKQLESVDVSSEQFNTALRRPEALPADHIQDDEGEQFPQLRRRIPHLTPAW